MDASDFDEVAFFRAIARNGVRALLIGRRDLMLLGLPATERWSRDDAVSTTSLR